MIPQPPACRAGALANWAISPKYCSPYGIRTRLFFLSDSQVATPSSPTDYYLIKFNLLELLPVQYAYPDDAEVEFYHIILGFVCAPIPFGLNVRCSYLLNLNWAAGVIRTHVSLTEPDYKSGGINHYPTAAFALPLGLEPRTLWLTVRCSNQLS